MAAYGTSSLRYQLESLQSKPVHQKCRETEDLLKRTSTKELHLALPVLLNSVFGGEGEPGWGLDKLCRSQAYHDFDALRRFLAPEGPLLTAVYSLQADPYATYTFPFSCLPGPSRHTIEEGGLPLFYINKLQTHGFSGPTVVLNAFEMYMFTFAYALVSPAWQQPGTGWSTRLFDWFYPTLVEDYLFYFLPLEGKELPSLPHLPTAVRSPVGQVSVCGRPVQRTAPYSPPRMPRTSLFKASFNLAQKQHALTSSMLDSAEAETWHSETMLQIFVEFWLNQNSLVADIPTFSHGNVEHFMPSLNQVLVVRMMVKYLHYFTNNTTTIITSPYHQHIDTPLQHLKRTVVPQLVQKKLYWFLRHAFDRWPLDCYFRMVMEVWLSAVQPWRYVDVTQYRRDKASSRHAQDSKERRVEDKWQQYIEDNLLLYTVLFHELLPRLYRMDFTSPPSAYILFRLAKVFSAPNLADLISNAEHEVCGVGLAVPLSHTADLGGSYLSASRLQPPPPTLPPPLVDMEVAGFRYHPLFSDRTCLMVSELLQKAAHAHAVLTAPHRGSAGGGGWSWLWSWLGEGGDHGGLDVRRTPKHLQQAAISLASIFQLPRPDWLCEGQQWKEAANDSTMLEEDDTVPDCVHTPEGPKLTEHGRYQIINNMRRFQDWQTGDPDLQPIRSFENATLVRFLYRVCSSLNSHFVNDIWKLYHRNDFVGRVAKVYLAPPLSPSQPITSPVSPDTAQRLRQPRVSLRVLGSYQTLVVLVVLYMVLQSWLGTGPVSFTVLLAGALLLYGVVRAVFSPAS